MVTNPQDEKTQNCSCCQSRIETKLLVIWSPNPAVSFPFVLEKTKRNTFLVYVLGSVLLVETLKAQIQLTKFKPEQWVRMNPHETRFVGSRRVTSKDSFLYLVTQQENMT